MNLEEHGVAPLSQHVLSPSDNYKETTLLKDFFVTSALHNML